VILDTNALSAFADGEPGVLAEVGKSPRIEVPCIVLGEFLFGIAQSRRRNEYERWINQTLDAAQYLDLTTDTAAKYAEVRLELKRAGTPIPANDMWIAALCRQHTLPLLSRDRHFESVKGLRRIGWQGII
jgi:tRNA(fMet)-specific endonuclease VapC